MPARDRRRPQRLIRHLLLIALFAALLPATPAVASDAAREQYRQALRHLATGRLADYAALRDALADADYPLAPYLDYHELSRRLDRVTDAEMAAFRTAHGDIPAARTLYARWLRRAGEARDWRRLAANPPEGTDATARCLHLRGRLATGDAAAALTEVPPLWTVGRSQPAACDPLFDAWIAAGGATDALAWLRLTRALEADQPGLARYLLRFFADDRRQAAQALVDVHVTPAVVLDHTRFAADDPTTRLSLRHGLRRLAASDPSAADEAWGIYRRSHRFDAADIADTTGAILLGLARAGRVDTRWSEAGQPAPDATAAAIAQLAVNRQQWPAASYWIEQLSEAARAETRWQYWLGRALEQIPGRAAQAPLHYQAAAGQRDYYGFLAAHRLGAPVQLNAARYRYDPEVERAVRARPAVRRALELEAVGDSLNARREWHHLVAGLSRDEQIHAAYVAQQAGAIPESIHIANAAMLRDHVDLRFPVAYPDLFASVSRRTEVSKPFLLAIARQESLFDPAARSSANARGVMQLLPSTATHVARLGALARPATDDLHQPAVNVDLGGRHLARLLGRYGDRRPLAAAAYNAGEGRVDRWIRERAGEPIDVWIETIPFGETRNYVKNVMAFTQVYAQLLETPVPILTPQELSIP